MLSIIIFISEAQPHCNQEQMQGYLKYLIRKTCSAYESTMIEEIENFDLKYCMILDIYKISDYIYNIFGEVKLNC